MRAMGLSRERVTDHPGNVHDPVPELEQVHGDWPRTFSL
jgi:hypothetical protein